MTNPHYSYLIIFNIRRINCRRTKLKTKSPSVETAGLYVMVLIKLLIQGKDIKEAQL
jgi:hypothetical protein